MTARRRNAPVRPYLGESTANPDPAVEIVEIKRLDRIRSMAPALCAMLITGKQPAEPTTRQGRQRRPPRKIANAGVSHLPYDPGPSMRLNDNGNVISWGGAASVVVEDRPDPDPARRTPVRGARRRDALHDLKAQGAITKRQFDATWRFLDDCSLASGGGLVANWLATPSGGGPRAGLAQAQVDAITRVREVFHLLGLSSGTVFWRVVLDDWPLSRCDAVDRVRNGTSGRLLCEAMDALDEHYHQGARR